MDTGKAVATSLVLSLALLGCDSLADFVTADPSELIRVEALPDSIPADGYSRTTIRAHIPPTTQPETSGTERRTVRFVTSLGTFVGGSNLNGASGTNDQRLLTAVADIEGNVAVELRSASTVASARVQATTLSAANTNGSLGTEEDQFGATTTVSFTPAYPDRIAIEITCPASASSCSTFAITLATPVPVQLNATLSFGRGIASEGTVVEWLATTPGGAPIGQFQSVTLSNATGKATAIFNLGTTTFMGQVTFYARVRDRQSGRDIEGTATIQVVK